MRVPCSSLSRLRLNNPGLHRILRRNASDISLTPRLSSAIADITSLPEVQNFLQSPTSATAISDLSRAYSILHSAGDGTHLGIIHSLLAKYHHAQGNLRAELESRAQSVQSFITGKELHAAAGARTALALASLQGTEKNVMENLGSAAVQHATTTRNQMAGRIVSAAAKDIADEDQYIQANTVLSAIARGEQDPLWDAPGFARALQCMRAMQSSRVEDAVDFAKSLVIRWNSRNDYDQIEALCMAARCLMLKHNKEFLQEARDFYTKALEIAKEIGNDLDKSEPLLGLASICERAGDLVEAEGLYRAVEERFEKISQKNMFSVPAAEVYVKALQMHAAFLDKCEVNGRKRDREAQAKRKRAVEIRNLFPQILSENLTPAAPLWVVTASIPVFEIDLSTSMQQGRVVENERKF